MADGQDLYETLGVARDADLETLRKAYRSLARQNHPDLNPDDQAAEERFKAISRAWEVLSDPEKRRNYDEFGELALEGGFDAEQAREAREAFGSRFGFQGGPPPGAGEGEFHFGGIDDLLGRMFGQQRGGGPGPGIQLPGADLEASLELDFLEAVRGCERRLSLGRPTPGGGVQTESVTVRIPPGVDTGGRLRVPGKGAPGIGGGPPGDLWVSLRVRPHRGVPTRRAEPDARRADHRARGGAWRAGRGSDARRARDADDPARHRRRNPAAHGAARAFRCRAPGPPVT